MGFNFTGEPRTGIQHRIVALRSLFRALRQEKLIFRDPTRGISLPATTRPPQPLPAERVAGLLDRAEGPAARPAVALVAIHALAEADLVRLQAAGLDLASCTLTVRRGHQCRIIYLDEVTAALASQWYRGRARYARVPQPGPLGSLLPAGACSGGLLLTL